MSDTYHPDQPPWAIGGARGYLEVGAQLCTRDGRRIGNAVVLEVMPTCNGASARIWTDACTDLVLNEAELAELFHEPEWLMDPDRSPAMTAFAAHRAVSYLITRIRTEPRVASLIGDGTQAFELLAAAWWAKTGMPVADLRNLAQISASSAQAVDADGPAAVEHLQLLPEGHPLRNTPLIEIGAERRWKKGGSWKPVQHHWAIATCTFNDLGDAWTLHDEWRATKAAPDEVDPMP